MYYLNQQYQTYKKGHKYAPPNRPVHSLLHFYGDKMSYDAKREFSILANDCQTVREADLLASAIIIAITQ